MRLIGIATAFACFAAAQIPLSSEVRAQGVLSAEAKEGVSGQLVWSDGSGGATTRARDETTNKDFSAETGVELRSDFNPDMTKFFAAMEAGAPIPWSLIEFPTKGAYLRARDAGYLEKLDPAVVDFSKLDPGTYDDYGVDVLYYGIVLTYNTDKFPAGTGPTSLRDLYDLEKFPGKRCMFKYPQYGAVLESALMADGVAKDQLYPLDLDRAFAKLDTIKADTIWWANGDDSIRLLASGECSIGVSWSGRVYSAVKNDKAPLAMVWTDSLYSQAVYAIPKGAPNPRAAQAMIGHFIADTEGQKELVRTISYVSGIAELKGDAYGADMAPWIATGANVENAVQEDAAYYAENLPTVIDRFNRWVASN